jgi:hypothetical protein
MDTKSPKPPQLTNKDLSNVHIAHDKHIIRKSIDRGDKELSYMESVQQSKKACQNCTL